MDYRALEDLIGILVKKSGFKLTDVKGSFNKDNLLKIKNELLKEIDDVKSRLDNYEYFDNNELNKDEQERDYLENILNDLNNDKNDIEIKLNGKEDLKLQNKLECIISEIEKVNEALKIVNCKLNNKFYLDEFSKNKDEVAFNDLEMELELVNSLIDNTDVNPVSLGNRLLESYKKGKSLSEVSKDLEDLVNHAKNNYSLTLDEIKDSNIFEIMDNYSTLKNEASLRVEKSDYIDNKVKEDLFEKTKYHNKRIENINNTLESIVKRKENLNTLIDESTNLYNSVRLDRISKEEKLKALTVNLYKYYDFNNYENDYEGSIRFLRKDIVDDTYLENKYKKDIQEFKEELRNLEINFNNLKKEIDIEEEALEIINYRTENDSIDYFLQIEDKVNLLNYSDRLASLENEQQYLYVNVDVIKEEIINLWNRNIVDSLEIEEVYEEPEIDMGSMYEEGNNIFDNIDPIEIDDSIDIDYLD